MTTTSNKTKTFTLMQLFSIVDGRLSNAGMDSVYDVLGHVSNNDGISTIGLVMVQDNLKANKPNWWQSVQDEIDHCKEAVGSNEFPALMEYIEKHHNPTFTI